MTHAEIEIALNVLIYGWFAILFVYRVVSYRRLVKAGKDCGIEQPMILFDIVAQTVPILVVIGVLLVIPSSDKRFLVPIILYSPFGEMYQVAKERLYRLESSWIRTPFKVLPFNELSLISYRKKWFSPWIRIQLQERSNYKIHIFSVSNDDCERIRNSLSM